MLTRALSILGLLTLAFTSAFAADPIVEQVRVAEAENRVTLLRERVERLSNEGSDASQARETFQVIARNLANLYVQQSLMRRSAWTYRLTRAAS